MPRPYVAATSRSGAPGLSPRVLIGADGSPLPSTEYAPPALSQLSYTPVSVPTTTWPVWSAVDAAGASGSSPEMLVNVAPASVDLNTWPVPTLLVSSPTAPGNAQSRP